MTIPEEHKHLKPKSGKYLFNHFELAFCGNNSIEKNVFFLNLIDQFGDEYDIGNAVYSPNTGSATHKSSYFKGANYHENEQDFVLKKTLFLNYDIVFATTQLNPGIPKIVYINYDETIEEIEEADYSDVIAFVGTKNVFENLPDNIPFFHIEELNNIKKYILNHFNEIVKKIPVYGLVLTGGQSRRMKKDKSLLKYHNKSQIDYLFHLLSPFCEKVFISKRKGQKIHTQENLERITDKFINFGPMGGILSAMNNYPDAAWLVMACDLPFVDPETIKNLVENRNPFKFATAYKSNNDDLPEPLCTIYEPKSKIRLYQFLGLGYYCPRKVLINSKVKLLDQVNKLSLTNVNYPEEYESAIKYLKQKEEK